MSIHTYRANSLHEALELIRRDLGPDASVLHTREVAGWFGWLSGARQIEVAASNTVEAPSRLPAELGDSRPGARSSAPTPASEQEIGRQFRRALQERQDEADSLVEDLCLAAEQIRRACEEIRGRLLELGLPDETSRELVARLHHSLESEGLPWPQSGPSAGNGGGPWESAASSAGLNSGEWCWERLAKLIEEDLCVTPSLSLAPGRRKVAAFVGPARSGKSTAIAGLVSRLRREGRRVGLISCEIGRLAAPDLLEEFAEAEGLPLEIAATPSQVREAADRLGRLDVILLDTPGLDPRNLTRLRELKALLAAIQPNEIHLVLNAAEPNRLLAGAVREFTAVGAAALILTRLDEAALPAGLLPVLSAGHMPLSFLAVGARHRLELVPARREHLARLLLGLETAAVAGANEPDAWNLAEIQP